jgi:DnaK suppressor protein
MRTRELERFEKLLLEQREKLVGNADRTLKEDMAVDSNDLPDEVDLASAEYNQAFTFRLRDRERFLLNKIDQALRKIEAGSFGTCEECEEPIDPRRMKARPVTTLCIRCKEDQEREERMYAS